MLLNVAHHDPVTQLLRSQLMLVTEQGIRLIPPHIRYAYPSELDLVAQLTAPRLRERRGGWHHEAFTAESRGIDSVCQRLYPRQPPTLPLVLAADARASCDCRRVPTNSSRLNSGGCRGSGAVFQRACILPAV